MSTRTRVAGIGFEADGRLTKWNPQAEAMFGWSCQEAVGQSLSALILPLQSQEVYRRNLKQFLDTGAWSVWDEQIEITARHRDGHEFPIELAICPIQSGESYNSPQAFQFNAFISDITERKQVEEKLRQQNEYLTALHETTLALMNRLEIHDLLETIVLRAGALVGTPHGFIRLVEPGETEMGMKVGVGIYSSLIGHRIKPGEGVAGKVWKTGQPLAVEDFHTWAGRIPDSSHDIFRAVVAVPLKSGSKVVGVIGLGYLEEGRTFGENEILLLSRFAQLASIALDNAQLYTSAQQELIERKRAEEALREARTRLQYLIDSSPAVIYSTQANGNYSATFVSENLSTILGYTPREALEDPQFWITRLHPQDVPRVLSKLSPLIAQGEGELEYRFRHRDGHYLWIRDAFKVICDTAGHPMEIVGSWTDITERKQSEEILRELGEKYRNIFENAIEGIFQIMPGGRYISANPALARIYGYESARELITHLTDFARQFYVEPDRRAEFIRLVQEHGTVSGFESQVYRKDGCVIWISEDVHSVRDKNGTLLYYEGTVEDITERKRAEEELQRSTRLVQLLQVVAIAANQASTVEAALQIGLDQICAYTGWPVGHVYLLTGDSKGELAPTTLWHLEDPERFETFRKVTDATRFASGVELPGRVLASGKPVWIIDVTRDLNFLRANTAKEAGVRAGFGFPVLVGAEVAAVLEFFSVEAVEPDKALLEVMAHIGTQLGRVFERKQAEEELHRQNSELEKTLHRLKTMQNQLITQEKLASLGALTAGIAHEIKNPLNFVNSFAELSLESIQQLLEELEKQKDQLDLQVFEEMDYLMKDLEENIQKINEHGKRADRIVQGMLLHARGKAGERQPTDLNALLAEYVNLAYHGMRAKDTSFNITMETDYDPSLRMVEVVPQDIGRVFLNVLNNACYAVHQKRKARGEGFHPQLWVRSRDLGEWVEVRIRDNGPGIGKEVVDKIFMPFFTTKPAGEGTGLGLSISYDIVVQEHRGEIRVETEEGEYTEFRIRLPKRIV